MNTKRVVFTSASTFLIIIGAYLSIQIGPVPIVLTNFFIILIGIVFGWRVALLSILTYIILGATGLPVFSNGKGGLAHILGLTGGFLLGFIPLAFFSGLAKGKSIILRVLLPVIGSIILYFIGVPWAMFVYNNIIAPGGNKPLWDLATTLKYTTIPFLIPDLVKVVIAVAISKILEPVVDNFVNN